MHPIPAPVILLGIVLTLGIMSLIFARLEPGTRAAGGWGASIMMLGLGYALLQWEGRSPTLVSWLSEVILLSAAAVMHDAVRHFDPNRRPRPSQVAWAGVLACSLILLWFTFVSPSARIRIVAFSAGLAMAMAWAAAMSLKLPREINPAARRIFTGVIWCAAAVFVARAVGTLATGPHSDDYFRYDMLQPAAAAASMILVTAMTMSLMWMEVSLLNARLRSMASHDSLTQLLNHGAIMKACERELSRAERYGEPIALAMIDIDHFKNVNDKHGHAVGDGVLAHVASLIAHDMRMHDVAGRYGGEEGRYGGEEFIILMPQTNTAAATINMERLRQRIEANPYVRSGISVGVTVSIGIAELANHITSVESLVGASDRALYRAKRGGRNRIETACQEAREHETMAAPVIVTAMAAARQSPEEQRLGELDRTTAPDAATDPAQSAAR